MNGTSKTSMDCQIDILADIWINYRSDEEFHNFCEYNDLALPLAYAIENNIVKNTPSATIFIEETFALLLAGLDIEDTGFECLDDMLDVSQIDV